MAERPDPDAQMASARLGQVLGGTWTLRALLGTGGMAAVYEAVSKDGERAALKVLHPEMCRREEIRKRFAQEALAASKVAHPGVVAIRGTGEEPDGTAYIVMELLEGEPLGTILRREGPLPLPRLLDVLDQVLDTLAVAHLAGIVHRDLKPDNLFVTADGRIKVLDFGIARLLDDVPGAYKTKTGVTLGTVPFMSPEQALGKRAQVDGRSDLFSLGAMTFRIVARRNIHPAETDAELLVAMASKPAPPLASVCPEAPPGLAALVDVALAFSKDSRYPDAKTMQSDVRALAAGKPPPYATRLRRAREMATRTDLVATPSPAPAVALAVPPPSQAKTLEQPIEPGLLDDEADEAPPSSQWPVLSMMAVPDLTAAKPAESPPRRLPTEPMPKAPLPLPHDGPTPVSAPPAPSAPARTSRAPLLIFAVVVACVSGGVAYYFATGSGDSAPTSQP